MATEKRLISKLPTGSTSNDGIWWERHPTYEDVVKKIDEIIEVLNTLLEKTTVDAVEVVRCKDCVHYRHGTSCVCDLHSEEPDQYGRGFDMQMLPNDFCPYGERKTDA